MACPMRGVLAVFSALVALIIALRAYRRQQDDIPDTTKVSLSAYLGNIEL